MLKCPGSDLALLSAPELFACPHCGEELEIWRDERKGTCATCTKRVTRDDAMAFQVDIPRKRVPITLDDEVMMSVCESTDPSGESLYYERYEAMVLTSAMEHNNRYKKACEACNEHGKNLACPPFSPCFTSYAHGKERARVICLRLPLEYFAGDILQESYRLCFIKVRSLLMTELTEAKNQGYTVAGAGPCMACDSCAARQGFTVCHKPEECTYSLESLGVNLVALAKRSFSLNLEWSRDGDSAHFVCAMGAVFFGGSAA